LLKKQAAFTWLPDHDKAFIKTRRLLSQVPALAYYALPRQLSTPTPPASRYVDSGSLTAAAGLRFIVPAES